MNLTVAALWQYQYKSVGPAGYDIKYNKIPEWFVGLDFSNNGFKIGTGLDIFIQTPRVSATSGDTVWGVDEKVAGFSPILYTNYHVDKFTVKAKCVFGQNTAHLSQYSGFGATKENSDGSYDYKPMRNLSVWGDVSYGTTWKVNLFGGYFKNFGLSDELVGNLLYMRSSVKNLDYAWRLCPAVSFNRKGLSVGLEYEFTDAGYGDGFDEYAKVEAERDVVNHRICCMLKYAW